MFKFGDHCSSYYDTKNQLIDFLRKKNAFCLSYERKEKDNFKCYKDFEERRARIKSEFIKAIGGLPERTPLSPRITGTIKLPGYNIEKIIFQSRPNFFVTSNLYIPNSCSQGCPAVLFVSGHSEGAKAHPQYQKVCIDLVKNGFIVFAIDPIGQGERKQYYNANTKITDISWGTTEHNYEGLQCVLTGGSLAGYFIWDMVRALDYLCTRSEVNKNRIGVTGNSGGGTQASYITLVDDRIKCSIPCTFINTRESLFESGIAHDLEQNIFSAVSIGLNHDDFLTAIAPRPVQIGAVAYDFFPIEGALKAYEKAKKIYALFGAEDKVNLVLDNSTHEYSDKLREASVNWFKTHLKGESPDFMTDKGMETLKEKDLHCTKEGFLPEEFKSIETVQTLNMKYAAKTAPKIKPVKTDSELKKHSQKTAEALSRALCYSGSSDRIMPRIMKADTTEYFKYEKLFYFTEEGITNTALLIKPLELDSGKTYIMLFEKGTNEFEERLPLIKTLAKKGYSLFIPDLRGIGAVAPRNTFATHGFFDMEYRLNCDAMMLGTSLTAMRVFDILRAREYLFSREDVHKENISLIGYGALANAALMAATLELRFKTIILSDLLWSYMDVVNTRLYHYDNKLMVNGLLKFCDIPGMIAAVSDRDLRLVNLKDAADDPLPKDNELIRQMKALYPAALNTGNISFHYNSDVKKII